MEAGERECHIDRKSWAPKNYIQAVSRLDCVEYAEMGLGMTTKLES
jgi:hypothetical protein